MSDERESLLPAPQIGSLVVVLVGSRFGEEATVERVDQAGKRTYYWLRLTNPESGERESAGWYQAHELEIRMVVPDCRHLHGPGCPKATPDGPCCMESG